MNFQKNQIHVQMGMLKIQYQSNIGINMICMPCDESYIQVHVAKFEVIISTPLFGPLPMFITSNIDY
jgi:hypothetical protein